MIKGDGDGDCTQDRESEIKMQIDFTTFPIKI